MFASCFTLALARLANPIVGKICLLLIQRNSVSILSLAHLCFSSDSIFFGGCANNYHRRTWPMINLNHLAYISSKELPPADLLSDSGYGILCLPVRWK
ncbi:hypothetical protein ANRL3_02170 [Anaerolineae bacterium]|nr:hypothetical protein ANRL3_02170 [Anaerolineae bacterium]